MKICEIQYQIIQRYIVTKKQRRLKQICFFYFPLHCFWIQYCCYYRVVIHFILFLEDFKIFQCIFYTILSQGTSILYLYTLAHFSKLRRSGVHKMQGEKIVHPYDTSQNGWYFKQLRQSFGRGGNSSSLSASEVRQGCHQNERK